MQIGDKKAGPLWGDRIVERRRRAPRASTRWPASSATRCRISSPGSLTDEEAQQVAAFITSKPRPPYPFKARDYSGSKVPVDAVYYRTGVD